MEACCVSISLHVSVVRRNNSETILKQRAYIRDSPNNFETTCIYP